jgi:hypothetical protein
MGDNKFSQNENNSFFNFSENENEDKDDSKSIIKLEYFENKKLNIKKIGCGDCFNIFLTGRFF